MIVCAVLGAIVAPFFLDDDGDTRLRDKMAFGAINGAGCVIGIVRMFIPLIMIALIIRACR